VETKDASQINPTNFVDWLTVAFTSTTPTNTDLRILFSVDDRVSWLTWSGSAWVAPASATTRTDATILADAVTNFSTLTATKPLDVRVFIRTTDAMVTSSMDNIAVTSTPGFETSGDWTSGQYNSTFINTDWRFVTFTRTEPSGSTATVKVRAANSIAELDAASYTTVSTSGTDIAAVGQYIQFQVSFAGTSIVRSNLDTLAVDFVTSLVQQVAP